MQKKGKYQYPTNGPVKPPIDYEENKKVLNEERKREYNQLMEKVKQGRQSLLIERTFHSLLKTVRSHMSYS